MAESKTIQFTPDTLKEWTDYDEITAMDSKKLEQIIELAKTRLGVYLCDENLAQFVDGNFPIPVYIALCRLAEVYAMQSLRDSHSISGLQSETMGNYSYSRGDSSTNSPITDLFASMGDMLGHWSLCKVDSLRGYKVRMRRV
jgi:hypothetical protein